MSIAVRQTRIGYGLLTKLISGTPLLWTQIIARDPKPFRGFGYLTVSGGSLPSRQLTELAAVFPGAEIIRTYGQTETFRTLLCRDPGVDTLGFPIEGVSAKILRDDGSECESDEPGELVHSGAGEMLGYFGEASVSREGIRTGDIFARGTTGFRYLGRRDDMIKRFDSRVHLKEIELAVSDCAGVIDAAVIARAAPEEDVRQTLIRAYVQLRNKRDGNETSQEEILD